MGSTWGWGLLWKGSFQGGQVCRLCSEVDCEVAGESWAGKESAFTGKEGVGGGGGGLGKTVLMQVGREQGRLRLGAN